MSQRRSVSISVDRGIDEFFDKCTKKVINIDGHEVIVTKSKNELYNLALQFALEHADHWLFFQKDHEN